MAFSRSTPCFAHLVKSPFAGVSSPMSDLISLNIFISDGGGATFSGTENESP